MRPEYYDIDGNDNRIIYELLFNNNNANDYDC